MKRIISALTAILLTASLLASCGSDDNSSSGKTISQPDSSTTDSSTPDSKDSSAPDSDVPDNDGITPNAESDFVWHVLTSEETTNPKCVGGVVITSYVGESDEVVIPKTIDDKPVVAIGEFAFSPYSIDDISSREDKKSDVGSNGYNPEYFEELFDGELSIYDVIEELEGRERISKLKSVLLPDSVSLIGNGAFLFCDSLEKVLVYGLDEGETPVLNSGVCVSGEVFEIGQFCGCLDLRETNFYMNVVDYIQHGSQCYDYCINLEKVYLYPAEEGKLNFSWCIPHSYKINDVTIADGTTKILKYDDEMSYPFKDCTFYVPASVTEQGAHSFCQHYVHDFGSTDASDVSDVRKCSYDSITIITPAGSYAEQFAKENGINYENE